MYNCRTTSAWKQYPISGIVWNLLFEGRYKSYFMKTKDNKRGEIQFLFFKTRKNKNKDLKKDHWKIYFKYV